MNNKGFTLVELIATIAILAIIAVISFVSINEVITKSDVKNCESLVNNIKSSAMEFVSDNRYNNIFVDNADNNSLNVVLGVSQLNLSDNISNSFDSSIINSVQIRIELNDDYTAKNADVYVDKNADNVLADEEKFSCTQEWLQLLVQYND